VWNTIILIKSEEAKIKVVLETDGDDGNNNVSTQYCLYWKYMIMGI